MKPLDTIPSPAPSPKRSGAMTRIAAASGAAALILANQGCSTYTGAAAGGAIGSFGGPVTAGLGAAMGASVGRSAEEAKGIDNHVKTLFDKVPLAIIKKSGSEWKSLAHYVNAQDVVTISPKSRKGSVVTFLVTARYGNGTIVGPVEIDRDISK